MNNWNLYQEDFVVIEAPKMIICGDALTELRKLPDESVNFCVTSPPYWGLRDYGTAKWEGGDQNCDHKTDRSTRTGWTICKQSTNPGSTGNEAVKTQCPKCGAVRLDSQLGLEKTPELYVQHLVEVFREVKRVLMGDGTLWLNLGDSYAAAGHGWGGGSFPEASGHSEKCGGYKGRKPPACWSLKQKDLVGIPWRVAFALQADGWYLRSDIIWAKPNPMPESVRDRPTRSHEYIFLMSKSAQYYFDQEAVKEPTITNDISMGNRDITKLNNTPGRTRMGGLVHNDYNNRNIRSVWTITTKPFKEAHFATFPPELPERCIKAGCPVGGVVLDPFFGAGTVGVVAKRLGRDFIGIELNPKYCEMAERRINGVAYQMEITE